MYITEKLDLLFNDYILETLLDNTYELQDF